ncbi:MAG: flagellar basal body rod protein FlgC [Ignavibacteriales bacterium]
MGFLNGIDICASGLTAQRLRMDVISNNLSNATTTRTEKGGPYRRQTVVFEARADKSGEFGSILQNEINKYGGGVRVTAVREDTAPFRRVYEPSNPDADQEGYVSYPNVNVVAEMVDMISATRSYEANVTAMNSIKAMALKAIDIGR